MPVVQISSREFRANQASVFDLADNGAQVVIRRRGKTSYMLTPIYDDDFALTPEMEHRLEDSRAEYKSGKVLSFSDKDKMNEFLESL